MSAGLAAVLWLVATGCDGAGGAASEAPRASGDPFALEPYPQTCSTDAPLADLDRFVAPLQAGAVVRLPAGTVATSLVVQRSLRLEAAGSRPVLTGVDGRFGATLLVDAPGARVELVGVVVEAPPDGPAIVVEAGTLVLTGCVILSESGDGVHLRGEGARLVLRDTLATTRFTALRVAPSATAVLDNSEFVRCGTGVFSKGHVVGRRLRIARGGTGVSATGGTLDLSDSTVWANAFWGLSLWRLSSARLADVEVRAPGGAPALRIRDCAPVIVDCAFLGTPKEVDHHAGEVDREHLERELTVGIDHHVLESLVEVLDGATPDVRRCTLRNALGHGLHVQQAGGRFEQVTIAGSVMFGALFEDGADPRLIDCVIADSGENGLFAWRGAEGRLSGGELTGNGRYSADPGGWAQVVLTEGARTVLDGVTLRGGVAGGVDVSGVGTLAGLTACTLSDHGGDGLRVHVGATAVVEGGHISGNGGAGLRATSGAVVELDRTELSRNGAEGVRVGAGARVALSRSRVLDNGRYGVVFDGGSAGSLGDSRVEGNRIQDVVIGEGAEVVGGAGP